MANCNNLFDQQTAITVEKQQATFVPRIAAPKKIPKNSITWNRMKKQLSKQRCDSPYPLRHVKHRCVHLVVVTS